MEIKFFLLAFLILLFTGSWVLSSSKFGEKIIMSDRIFNLTNFTLLICSAAGLIATLVLKNEILTSHLFEILLLPALVAFLVSGLSRKVKNADDKFDEKQQCNMKDAAAFSWMVVIIAIFIIYAAYSAGNISGLLFFPLIIYIAFTAYSGSLIYFYKIG